jgi:hypothetical protein
MFMKSWVSSDFMARVVRKNVRGVHYLQIIEDYKDDAGAWHQKVLQSFGDADDPRNYLEAVRYAAAVNAFKEQSPRPGSPGWNDWSQAAAIALGAVALGWLISQFFEE